MNADEILTKARAEGERPANWVVFPLLRDKIIMTILGWIGGVIIGGGLLALIVPIVLPGNYERGLAAAIMTTLFLGIFTFIFVGSLVLLVSDIRRLHAIEKHIIVITDEDFVKQEGEKLIQVPLLHVRHVTARGRAPSENKPVENSKDRDTPLMQVPSMRENLLGMLLGRGATGSAKTRRKRMRTPTSLAFIDDRTEQEVTVLDDGVYGDPFHIAAVLKERVAAATAD